jgi:hypothetical protein
LTLVSTCVGIFCDFGQAHVNELRNAAANRERCGQMSAELESNFTFKAGVDPTSVRVI